MADGLAKKKRKLIAEGEEIEGEGGELEEGEASMEDHAIPSSSFSGPTLVGDAGKVFILQGLSTAANPGEFIRQFQESNGIHLPSCKSALPLLDLHNIPRPQIYKGILSTLRDKLSSKLGSISRETLDKLLVQTFSYIATNELQPVAMTVLKMHPDIPTSYLKILGESPDLYQACPIEVKRQIWAEFPSLFEEVVTPWIQEYLSYESIRLAPQYYSLKHQLAPKKRRELKAIVSLLDIIGPSYTLYNSFLGMLRKHFKETQDVRYCSLRIDILMAIHDVELAVIFREDPCHTFTLCLTACVRDESVDLKRTKELVGFIEKLLVKARESHRAPSHQNDLDVLFDLALILTDPFASNTLAATVIGLLPSLIKEAKLPSSHEHLASLMFLIQYGDLSFDFPRHVPHSGDITTPAIMRNFFPWLVSFFVDDFLAAKSQDRNSVWRCNTHVIKELAPFLQSHRFLVKLVGFYCIKCANEGDCVGLGRLFTLFKEASIDISHQDLLYRAINAKVLPVLKKQAAPEEALLCLIEHVFVSWSQKSFYAHRYAIMFLNELQQSLSEANLMKLLAAVVEQGFIPDSATNEYAALYHLYSTTRFSNLSKADQLIQSKHATLEPPLPRAPLQHQASKTDGLGGTSSHGGHHHAPLTSDHSRETGGNTSDRQHLAYSTPDLSSGGGRGSVHSPSTPSLNATPSHQLEYDS